MSGQTPERQGWRDAGRTRAGAAALLCILALALTFLWELWAASSVPVARDMQLYFVPLGRQVWNAIRSGEGFLWTPFLGTGSPLLANLQTGFFYPPNWLHGILPFLRSFSLSLVAHFALGGIGTYALCRRVELPPASAFLAAVTYMLGGYYASLTNLLTVLQVSAWLPLQCLTVVHHVERRSIGSFVGLLGVHLCSFLAGAPLTFLLASGLAVAYSAFRIAGRGRPRGRPLLVLTGSMAVVAALVAGISMVQILPMAEYVGESIRADGLPFELATRFSLQPLRLVEFAVPPSFQDPVYRFGTKSLLTAMDPWLFSVYLGASVLVPAAAAFTDRRRRSEALFWTAVAIVGLVLSLGHWTPVYRWLYDLLPGFAAFRYPERFFVLTGFAVAMLAAHGLAALRDRSRRIRGVALVAGSALLLGAVVRALWVLDKGRVRALVAAHLPDRPFLENFEYAHGVWSGQIEHAVIFLALALAAVAAYRLGWLRERVFVLVVLAVCSLDLWLAHRHLTPVVDEAFFEATPLVAESLSSEMASSMYRYRATPFDEDIDRFMTLPGLGTEASKWLWQHTLHPNSGAYHGVLTHDSGDAIHLRREADETHFLRLLPPRDRWRLLRLGSVKYLYSMTNLEQETWTDRTLLDSIPGWLYTVRDPVPRAYVASHPRFFDSELDALNAAISSRFDPHRDVALVGDARGSPASARPAADRDPDDRPSANGRARILSDSGSRVRVAVSTPVAGYLVLTDTYYPGWRARVDGAERPILQANYFYRAVPVEPGDREVVFSYEPASVQAGMRISLATLASLLLGLGAVGWRRYRRAERGTPVRRSDVEVRSPFANGTRVRA